jgi:hypothetical protein
MGNTTDKIKEGIKDTAGAVTRGNTARNCRQYHVIRAKGYVKQG